MNCHSQIWTNAQLLEPVRQSWATGESIQWIRVHDLPDYVYFNHEIHVNKGIGCASCHGRVDEMPLMYAAEHAADGVVPELPSQPGREPAADERDLQHGVGWTFERQAGLVREHGQGRTDGAGSELHDEGSERRESEVAMLQQLRRRPGHGESQSGTQLQPHPTDGRGPDGVAMCRRRIDRMPASYQKFTSQIDLGTLPDGASTTSARRTSCRAARCATDERDAAKSETQTTADQGSSETAQVVTAIAPAKMTLAEVRAKLDGKTRQALLEEPGRAGGDAGVPGADAGGVSAAGRRGRVGGCGFAGAAS